jgi:hypothetical protein
MHKNKMKNLKPSILLLIGIFLCCKTFCKNELIIYKDKSIEFSFEKAQEKKQKMCLVLIDERDTISRAYMEKLETAYKNITEDAVFNIVDVTNSENRWYKEWINSWNYPVTCVFSEEEKLIAVIGGASIHSFSSIKAVLEDMPGSNFGYKSALTSLDFNVLFAFLDDVLKCKLSIDRGENCDVAINETFNVLQYPFNTYLKFKNEISQNKIDDATNTARQLLQFKEDIQYLRVYSEMFEETMRLIDPNYSPDNNPVLTVQSGNIVLHNCTLNNPVPFQITIKNTGKSMLRIKAIDIGCSCITSLNKDTVDIDTNKEDNFDFTFTPNSKGKTVRTVTFVSNATNYFEQIEIIAFVN